MFSDLGLIARSGGDLYIFNPDVCCWQNVANKSCQVFFNGNAGITNATVNYTVAFEQYLPAITKAAKEVGSIPCSVCIGDTRFSVVLVKGGLLLEPSGSICCVPREMGVSTGTFCIKPVVIALRPKTWCPTNVCTISCYLGPLFTSHEEYEGLLWLVGNALLDPQPKARLVILHGPGGTGKSTLLSCLRTVLRGVCQAADISGYVTARGTKLPSSILETLFSSRVTVCGEVDFSTDIINSHFLKAITGSGPLPLPPFDASLSATTIVGSNSLPRVAPNTEWRSPSHARRVYVIPMTRDATSLASWMTAILTA